MFFLVPFVCLVAAPLLALAAATGENSSVNLQLVASWNATPFKLNVLESFCAENSSLYTPLVEKLFGVQIDTEVDDDDLVELVDEPLTDEEYYQFAVSLLADSKTSLALAQISLANRIHSPRIEAQYKYFRDQLAPKHYCDDEPFLVQSSKEIYCEPTDVYALKTSDQSADLLPTDRILGKASSPVYAIYGHYDDPNFREAFGLLYQEMLAGKLSFVWRYTPGTAGSGSRELVGGYGADLTLKRTDYIVIDDRGFNETQQGKMKQFDQDDDDDYADVVSDETNFWKTYYPDIRKVNKEELSNLDLRLAKFIVEQAKESSDSEGLELLQTIVQDFPKYASSIADLDYEDKELTHMALAALQDSRVEIPNGLYINNALLPDAKGDIFEVLRLLRRELKYTSLLRRVGFNSTEANRALSAFASFEALYLKMPYRRYDYSDYSDSIVYFNDIANDEEYQDNLPAREAYANDPELGEIPPARENIYEMIFMLDLSDPMTLYYTLALTNRILKQKVPQRIGVIPLIHKSKLGRTAAKQFFAVNQTEGPVGALQYLHSLNHLVTNGKLTKNSLRELGKDVDYKDVDLSHVKSFNSNFHLGKTPSVIVDGVIFPFDENWQAAVQQLSFDVYDIFSDYQNQRIPDNVSFRDYLRRHALKTRIPYLIPDSATSATYLSVPALEELNQFWTEAEGVQTYFQGKCDGDNCTNTAAPKSLTLIGSMSSDQFKEQAENAIAYKNQTNRIKLRIVDSDVEGSMAHIFGVHDNSSYLVVNGRLIDLTGRPLVTPKQFALLVDSECSLRLNALAKIVKMKTDTISVSRDIFSDKYDWYEYCSWLITDTYYHNEDEFSYETLPRYNTDALDADLSLHIPSKTEPQIHLVLAIDPATGSAQKYLSMLSLFQSMDFVDTTVYLRPSHNLEKLDITRLYRGVFPSAPQFTKEAGEYDPSNLQVQFTNVPERTLFTSNIDDPQHWITTIHAADADMDNVKLDLSGPVHAVYELENLLVEGYARDISAPGLRPVALPVELVDGEDVYSDTSIMANYGYLQLKANPGSWKFEVKPKATGDKVYALVSVENGTTIEFRSASELKDLGSYTVDILDLEGKTIYPAFMKRAGQENVYLVNDGPNDGKNDKSSSGGGGIFGKLKDAVKPKDSSEINIFTVASGRLYERFLSIMTASVMAHTEHTVKFWLLENYMSPQLKEELPSLAEHYKFKYELITYKWPSWLRHQREKQRIVWGYKILFLDVLFPQSLDKVIYVDSDQIVRTDLKELVDEDLEGAPYGFTPMCEDRKETEGFRFWKEGYWKRILQDKYKYHISALYVVDLNRFRGMAAGDVLRHHYQQLSADPKSLSNLDQDLPNNLQEVLPIHSLPQDWLWCETWCSDDGLERAKTIDLCNNPLTKEPKLDRARRQIPEWVDYDEEVAEVIRAASGSSNSDLTSDGDTVGEDLQNEHDEL